MTEICTTKDDIELLRDKLASLIRTKNELLDQDVLKASVMLDNALNDYIRQKLNGS